MSPDRELSSWKEIAAYLDISIRAAQSWETERGLPVHRLPGGRGRVSVTVSELEDWKRSASERKPVLGEPPPRLASRSRLLLVAGILVPVLVSAAVFLPGVLAGRPVSYRIQGNTLIVLDAHGRELWSKVFPYALAQDLQMGPPWQFIWFGELEGRPSLLVTPIAAGSPRESFPLICYSARGEERWRFTPGRDVRSSAEEFDPLFGGPNFRVGPLGKDGRTRIVAVSSHHLFYPTQVTLLSTSGKVLREYWHSGHLRYIELADLDGDGANEIYLAGVNNARKVATIVVLDPDRFGGASQETEVPDHQLLGFEPGRERRRVFLPRSCLSRQFDPYNTITGFWITGKILTVETNEFIQLPAGLHHRIDADFRSDHMDISDSYRIRYAQLKASGQLSPGCPLEELSPNLTVLPAMDPSTALVRAAVPAEKTLPIR